MKALNMIAAAFLLVLAVGCDNPTGPKFFRQLEVLTMPQHLLADCPPVDGRVGGEMILDGTEESGTVHLWVNVVCSDARSVWKYDPDGPDGTYVKTGTDTFMLLLNEPNVEVFGAVNPILHPSGKGASGIYFIMTDRGRMMFGSGPWD